MEKKYILCFLILPILLLNSKLYGWEDIKTRITVTSKNGYSSDKLIFGLNSKATDGLDTILGELEAPPIGPPSGISPVFSIYDINQQDNIYTWLDLRPYPQTDTSTVTYIIEVFKATDDVITFNWNTLWPEIEKAILMDTMPNHKYAYVNMKDSTHATIANNYIHTFKLLINYKNITSANNLSKISDNYYVRVYPEIFNDILIVESSNNYTDYKIADILGSVVLNGQLISENTKINTESLSKGIYFLICNDKNGNIQEKKLLKI